MLRSYATYSIMSSCVFGKCRKGDGMKTFGSYLQSLRKGKMTQRELAKKVGVSFPYISKLENNLEPPPSDKVLLKMAEELGVDADEMFIHANRIPIDLKQCLIEKPEMIQLFRLIQKEDATLFLLEHFKELVKYNTQWKIFHESEKVMLLIDPETSKIIDANATAEKFYQYPLPELKKMSISDINILPKKKIYEEMNKARLELRNHFLFQHKLGNSEIKRVRVHSNPIILNSKIFLHSTIQENPSNSNTNML